MMLESDTLIIQRFRTDRPTSREQHVFAISQTASRTFFATHFPDRQERCVLKQHPDLIRPDRQERCVLYDARERRANNSAGGTAKKFFRPPKLCSKFRGRQTD